MQKKKLKQVGVMVVIVCVCLVFKFTIGQAASPVLKMGMRGSSVTELQRELKSLGYFHVTPTGYYGTITKASVKQLQARYGLVQDGIAGKNTFAVIQRLQGQSKASRGSTYTYDVPWFGNAERVFHIGKTATVYDIGTGLSFQLKRTYGYNHADCEPVSYQDTMVMKEIFGGAWNWQRRPVIVNVEGKRMAASLAGMPHAGDEKAPANQYIASRSGGYGWGANLDAVKGNGVSGVFDLHFRGSKTHGSNTVNAAHQDAVRSAASWAIRND